MSTGLRPVDRQIIPRWRDSAIAATTGELEPLKAPVASCAATSDELASHIGDWRSNRSISFASDLVSAGLVLNAGTNDDVKDAIGFIRSQRHDAPMSVSSLASAVAWEQNELESDSFAEQGGDESLLDASRNQIRLMKARLRSYPRNGMLWVDMARHYAMLGANRHAVRSMRNGLFLAPENRFALRSAARLFVHLGEPDLAYEQLRRSPATRNDPWLRAAEFAVAGVMDKTPRNLRKTRKWLQTADVDPIHISELASAVATFELRAGSLKPARRLFNLALRRPTENSVAQAGWATEYVGGISLNDKHRQLPRTYEARAMWHFANVNSQECIDECNQWLQDEPFSARPIELATFITIVDLEDYDYAITLANRGLLSNPNNFSLRNNLSVALAESGKVEEAKGVHDMVVVGSLEPWEQITYLATEGLIAFREDGHDAGRTYYDSAVTLAISQSNKKSEAMALIHWACEELKAGESEKAEELVRRSDKASQEISSTEVRMARSKFERLRRELLDKAQGLPAVKWLRKIGKK